MSTKGGEGANVLTHGGQLGSWGQALGKDKMEPGSQVLEEAPERKEPLVGWTEVRP